MGATVGRAVGGKAKGELAEWAGLIEAGVCGLFGAVAVATQHPHWMKSPKQVLPITAPLMRAIEDIPPSQRKKLAKAANPALFVVGCAMVAGPDLMREVRMRREEKPRVPVWRSTPPEGHYQAHTGAYKDPGRPVEQVDTALVAVPGGLKGVGE